MKVFYAFLIILVAVILFLLPITQAVYDFRTDQREDTFTSPTGATSTNATIILVKELYDDDISTAEIASTLSETPLAHSYTTATRSLLITGLTANTTRALTVAYDVDAISGNPAISTFASYIYLFWMLCIIAFPPAALLSLFLGRA